MPIGEAIQSQRTRSAGKESTHDRNYIVTAGGIGDAILQTKAFAPTEVVADGYTLRKRVFDGEQILDTIYFEVSCNWSHENSSKGERQNDRLLEVDDSELSFDFSMPTFRLVEAISQDSFGTNPPDFGNSINVDLEGIPQGVDLGAGANSIVVGGIIDTATVTQAWIAERSKWLGRTNSGDFRGYSNEELLFTRFSGRQTNSDHWNITFNFSPSETETGLSVGGIAVAEKLGWRYLWPYYEQSEDTTAKKLIPKIRAVYVAKTFETLDYDSIGVPT